MVAADDAAARRTAAQESLRELAERTASVLAEAGVPVWGLPVRSMFSVKTWATAWPLTGPGMGDLGVTPQGAFVRLPRVPGAVDYNDKVLGWVAENRYGGILQALEQLSDADLDVDGSASESLLRVTGDGTIRLRQTAMRLDDALLEVTARLVREHRAD